MAKDNKSLDIPGGAASKIGQLMYLPPLNTGINMLAAQAAQLRETRPVPTQKELSPEETKKIMLDSIRYYPNLPFMAIRVLCMAQGASEKVYDQVFEEWGRSVLAQGLKSKLPNPVPDSNQLSRNKRKIEGDVRGANCRPILPAPLQQNPPLPLENRGNIASTAATSHQDTQVEPKRAKIRVIIDNREKPRENSEVSNRVVIDLTKDDEPIQKPNKAKKWITRVRNSSEVDAGQDKNPNFF